MASIAGRTIDRADRIAQRAAHPGGPSELPGELAEQVLLRSEVAARRGDLWRRISGNVKCWNSATMSANASWKASTSGLVGRQEPPVHAVEQRVRRLVGDDVVRQAGEDHAARHVIVGVGFGAWK